MNSKRLLFALLAIAAAACGGPEASEQGSGTNAAAPVASSEPNAQASNAAESIKTRQTHYKAIGGAMKGISDELKKDAPDVAALQRHAGTIDRFAPQIQGWFPDGTGAAAGIKTAAREEIWSKPEEFRKAAADFVTAASRFNGIAASGDVAAIRDGVKPLGASCKACHDTFKAKD
jgi:cytochrome c556